MEDCRVAEKPIVYAIALMVVLGLALIVSFSMGQPAYAQGACCIPPPNDCCVAGTCILCDEGQPGGENPPPPTVPPPTAPPPPPPDPNNPTPVPEPGATYAAPPTRILPTCPPGGCPTATPRPTATPIPQWAIYTFYCQRWAACPEGYADVDTVYSPGGVGGDYWVVVQVRCKTRAECEHPTPTPGGPTPTPDPGNTVDPCDIPPFLVGGILRQPCSEWPGWDIQAEVIVPPAGVRFNPWTRALVGLPITFWWEAATDTEEWSAQAQRCDGVDYGQLYTSPTFDCGTAGSPPAVGVVGEGAQVNIQIGVAWRRWTRGDGVVFGVLPEDEAVLIVSDREWNGGTKYVPLGPNEEYTYIYETSSWGMLEEGPSFKAECQKRDCGCDERICNFRTMAAYQNGIITYWWPEWTFKYDQYNCQHWRTECQVWPGWGTAACDANGDGHNDPDTVLETVCEKWGWENKMGWDLIPGTTCPAAAGAWCKYDMRRYGGDGLLAYTGVNTGGADPDGELCTSRYFDYWPHVVPVPVIELQPVGASWPTPVPEVCESGCAWNGCP